MPSESYARAGARCRPRGASRGVRLVSAQAYIKRTVQLRTRLSSRIRIRIRRSFRHREPCSGYPPFHDQG